MKTFIKALIDLIKVKVVKRKFYMKFTAFMVGALSFKLDGDIKNDTGKWEDTKPSIYDLDSIVNEMNENVCYINKRFHLSINEWTRDDVRPYIDLLDKYHYQMSNACKKDLSFVELTIKMLSFVEESWFNSFKSYVKLHRELNA